MPVVAHLGATGCVVCQYNAHMKPLGLDATAIKTEEWLHLQIQAALTGLFESKQLYQSVTVDLAPIEKQILEIKAAPWPARTMMAGGGSSISQTQEQRNNEVRAPYRTALRQLAYSEWTFDTEYYPQRTPTHNQGAGPLFSRTPTIKVSCSFCDAVLPAHNSGYPNLKDKISSVPLGHSAQGFMQVFAFPFLCQSCKRHPVVYLVTRRGLKLTLTGRSEFPEVSIPKFIPIEEKDYFSKAVVSHSAGHTLAGILYLRVFIEQYMRRVTGAEGKKTGDQLGDLYRALLHVDFPKTFKSLAKIYEELSEKLHLADPSEEQFKKSKEELERHFQQLCLLPLKVG